MIGAINPSLIAPLRIRLWIEMALENIVVVFTILRSQTNGQKSGLLLTKLEGGASDIPVAFIVSPLEDCVARRNRFVFDIAIGGRSSRLLELLVGIPRNCFSICLEGGEKDHFTYRCSRSSIVILVHVNVRQITIITIDNSLKLMY